MENSRPAFLRSPPDEQTQLTLYTLYLGTAEKVSDRRAQANSWMLSINSAVVGHYGFLEADKAVVTTGQKAVWLWAIPTAGALVCVTWAALIASYRKLNRAKFTVLSEMEANLSVNILQREREVYRQDQRRSLSTVETAIPYIFVFLYGAIGVAALVSK
jgi:hypothetical protein